MIPIPDAWPEGILAELRDHPDIGVSAVLDPDSLLEIPAAIGQVVVASDWLGLRVAYEAEGRHRPPSSGRLVIHVQDPAIREPRDLPWDIEQNTRVVTVRFPGTRPWLPLWRGLGNGERRRFATLLERRRDPRPAEVIEAVFGVVLPAADEEAEFDAVARLRLSDGVPAAVWEMIPALVRGPLAAAMAAERIDVVQAAWADWLARGSESEWDSVLSRNRLAIVGLLTTGLLRRTTRSGAGLPDWTVLGAAEADPVQTIVRLLDERPTITPAANLDDWSRVAAWWGAVRVAMAEASPVPPALATAAWQAWDAIDATFLPWITENLGMLQTSSRTVPPTVDRIAPFLARRNRAGSKKICLIVMDGMGFTQWSLIRDRLGLRVEEAHGVAAVAPTLTPYSRQAIFAGLLPTAFADSLSDNSREKQRWMSFWSAEGIASGAIRYASTSGASPAEVPPVDGADILGVAVLAVDDLLHSASLLGDAEVAATLRVWLDHGFLRTLIANACRAGFEVWMTADHGNIEATAVGYIPKEGLMVDRTGQRVRTYGSPMLLDAARADGLAWQPPGLPDTAPSMLFARGRSAYVHGSGPTVVHGGLSLDEVIVPLVRVSL